MPDAGIASKCLGEMGAAFVRAAAKRRLNTAMLVAQSDFEVEHPLAVAVKAEMPRLDDPGMHRANRDLVNFGAGDPEELAFVNGNASATGETNGLEPRVSFRVNTPFLIDFTLEVMGSRAIRRERGITAGDHRCREPNGAVDVVGNRGQQCGAVRDLRQPRQQR